MKKYNKVFMNKKLKYIYHLAFVFFLSIMLINCEAKVSSHGKVIESHNYNKLEIGKSDVYDVIRILGKPSFMGAFGSRKFYYDRFILEKVVASKTNIQKRKLYILTFDENNVLESINLNDENNDNDLEIISEKTPTPGDKITVIEQVLSNLRKK